MAIIQSRQFKSNSTVELYVDGVLQGSYKVNAVGLLRFDLPYSNGENYVLKGVNYNGRAFEEARVAPDTTVPQAKPEILGITEDTGVAGDFVTSDKQLIINGKVSGALDAGDKVQVSIDGRAWKDAVVNADGTWTLDNTAQVLNEGKHQISVRVVDRNGNYDASVVVTKEILIDSTPAQPATIDQVIDDVDPISGPLTDGDSTNDPRPDFSGKAEPNSTVTIYDDGTKIGEVKTDPNGNWEFTPDTDLDEGPHTITVIQTDLAGNPSQPSVPFEFTVDTIAPNPADLTDLQLLDDVGTETGPIANNSVTDDTQPEFKGKATSDVAKVNVYDGTTYLGQAEVVNGEWTFTPTTELAEGAHSFIAKPVDVAGNEGAGTTPINFTIDTTPPNVTDLTDLQLLDDVGTETGPIANNSVTDDTQPEFKGKATSDVAKVNVYDGTTYLGQAEVVNGEWTFTPTTELAEGAHSFIAKPVDVAGNEGAGTTPINFTIDTTPPNVTDLTDLQLLDDVGTETGPIANNSVTDDTQPEFKGKATSDVAKVNVYDGTTYLGQAEVVNGEWTFTPTTELSEGAHSFIAKPVDVAGNEGAGTTPINFTIDTTPPNVTDLTDLQLLDDVGTETGPIANNSVTDDTQPEFKGKATSDVAKVNVYDGTTYLGQAEVVNGEWTFTPTTELSEGAHSFIAKPVDVAGNEGAGTTPINFTIDTTPPNVTDLTDLQLLDDVGTETGPIANNSVTDDTQPEFKGKATSDVAKVNVYDGTTYLGQAKVVNGEWTFTPTTELAEGAHSFIAKPVDVAGNEGAGTTPINFTIDTTPPNVTDLTDLQLLDDVGTETGPIANNSVTDDTQPEFKGKATSDVAKVNVYDGTTYLGQAEVVNGEWTFTPTTELSEGAHSFIAKPVDVAGNEGAGTTPINFTIDTTPPNVTDLTDLQLLDDVGTETGPIANNSVTDDTQPEFKGKATSDVAKVNVYDGTTYLGQADVVNGEWTFTPTTELAEGAHSFIAKPVDVAGNEGAGTTPINFTIDTTPPNVTDLTDLQLLDDVGTETGPIANNSVTDDTQPEFKGKATSDVAKVNVYDGTTYLGQAEVVNGEWTFTPTTELSEGAHSFIAKPVDVAGNEGAGTTPINFTIDTTPPNVTDLTDLQLLDDVGTETGPIANNSVTDDTQPEFKGKATSDVAKVNVYDGTTYLGQAEVVNGEWTFTPTTELSEGAHSFIAKPVDVAGNEGAGTTPINFTIDTTPPNVTDLTDLQLLDDVGTETGPIANNSVTDDTQPEFKGKATSDVAKVNVYDGTTYLGQAEVVNGEWTFTPTTELSEGAHSFIAKPVDVAGNEGAGTTPINFTIDTTPPNVTDLTDLQLLDDVGTETGPIANNSVTDDTQPEFKGKATSDVAKVNVYDGTTYLGQAEVVNGEWTFTPTTELSEGAHSFIAKPVDVAGNEGAGTTPINFTIDTTPPNVTDLTDLQLLDDVGTETGPIANNSVTDDTQPEFKGKATSDVAKVNVYDGTTYLGQAEVVNGEWTFTPTTELSEGAHSFIAKPVDVAGNEGAGTTPINFTIDTTPPNVTDLTDLQLLDDVGTETGPIANNSVTDDTQPEFKGKATSDVAKVNVYDGTTYLGQAEVVNGEWTFTPTTELAEGAHSFIAKPVDVAGNEGAGTTPINFTIDTTPPNVTDLTDLQLLDDVGTETGPIANNSVTDDTQPEFKGKATSDVAKVNVYDGTTYLGQAEVVNGEWTFTPTTELAEGAHSFIAKPVDVAGNEGAGTTPINFTIDTTPPNVTDLTDLQLLDDVGTETGPIANNSVTDDTQPEFKGKATSDVAKVNVYDGTTYFGQAEVVNGEWTFTPTTELSEGAHSFIAKPVDVAGNEGAGTTPINFTIDTTPPNVTDLTDLQLLDDVGTETGPIANNSVTDDTQPEFKGKATSDVAKVNVYDGTTYLGQAEVVNGEWTFTPTTELSEGAHSFIAKPVDVAGNEGAGTTPINFTIDTTPPNVTDLTDLQLLDDVGTETGPIANNSVTDDTQPEFKGKATSDVAKVNVYDGTTYLGQAEVVNGEWTFTPTTELAEGAHSFIAKPVDVAGNEGAGTTPINFTIDTTPPNVTDLTDLQLLDDVGTETGPIANNSVTDDTQPEFKGKATSDVAKVNVYDGTTYLGQAEVVNGEWTFTPTTELAEGAHSFIAKPVDVAGNEGAGTTPINFTIDTTPPNVTDLTDLQLLDDVGTETGPIANNSVTDDTQPEFKGKATSDVAKVNVYDGTTYLGQAEVVNGEWTFTPTTELSEGAHSFIAKPVDVAGNEGAGTTPINFTIDTTPPNVTDLTDLQLLDDVGTETGPIANNSVTDDTQPEFKGKATSDVAKVNVYDGTTYLGQAEVVNGEWTFTPTTELAEGAHSFIAKPVDVAGNEGAGTTPINFTIDTTPPNVTDLTDLQLLDDVGTETGPIANNSVTDDTQPEFKGKATSDVAKVNVYDGTTYLGQAEVVNGEWTFTPTTELSEGAHSFIAKPVDVAGNEGAGTTPINFTIDTTPPALPPTLERVYDDFAPFIGDLKQNDSTNDKRPDFFGKAEPGNTVVIYDNNVEIGTTKALADGTWTFTPTTDLLDGNHSIVVTQRDPAGNESPKSSAFDFVVDTLPPTKDDLLDIKIHDDVGTLQGEITNGTITDDNLPLVTGSATNGVVSVNIYNGTTLLGNAAVQADGTWSFTPKTALPDGNYNFIAKGLDRASNEGEATDPINFTVDTSVLPTSSVALTNYQDLGDSNSDFYSSDVKFSLSVKTEANAKVIYEEFVGGAWVALGTATANASGDAVYDVDWSALQIDDETRKFRANITDVAGNSATFYVGGTDEASAQEYRFDNVAKEASFSVKTSRLNNQGSTDVVDLTYSLPEQGARKVSVYSADFRAEGQISEKKFLFEFTTDANGKLNLHDQLSVLDNFKAYIYETVDAAGNVVVDTDFNRIYQTSTEHFSGQSDYKTWYYEAYSYLTEINATPIYVNPGVRFYNDAENLAGFANRLDGINYYDDVVVLLKLANGAVREATLDDKGYWSFSYNDVNPIGVGQTASLTLVARAMQADLQNDPSSFREDITADNIYAQQQSGDYYASTVSGLNGSYSYYNSSEVIIKGQAGVGTTDPLVSIVEQIYTSTRDNDAIYSNGIKTTLVYEVLDTIDASLNSNGKYLGETGTTIGVNGYGSQFDLGAFGNINTNGWIDRDGDDMIALAERTDGDFVDIDGDGIHDGLSVDTDRTVTDIWNHFDASKDQIDISAWIEQIEVEMGITIDANNITDFLSVEHVANASQGGKESTVLSIDRDGQGKTDYDPTAFLTLEARKVDLVDLLQNNILY